MNKIVDEYWVGVIVGYYFVVLMFLFNKVFLEFKIGKDYLYIIGVVIFVF